jgi:hypothetical protein
MYCGVQSENIDSYAPGEGWDARPLGRMVVIVAAAVGVKTALRGRPLQAPPRPLHSAGTLTLASSAAPSDLQPHTTRSGQKKYTARRKGNKKHTHKKTSSDRSRTGAARYQIGRRRTKLQSNRASEARREICSSARAL